MVRVQDVLCMLCWAFLAHLTVAEAGELQQGVLLPVRELYDAARPAQGACTPHSCCSPQVLMHPALTHPPPISPQAARPLHSCTHPALDPTRC